MELIILIDIPLNEPASLIVPTVTIYEVFKVILRESNENIALQAIMAMQKGAVVNLIRFRIQDDTLYKRTKGQTQGPAPTKHVTLIATWTQDSDFKDIGNVKYFSKK